MLDFALCVSVVRELGLEQVERRLFDVETQVVEVCCWNCLKALSHRSIPAASHMSMGHSQNSCRLVRRGTWKLCQVRAVAIEKMVQTASQNGSNSSPNQFQILD